MEAAIRGRVPRKKAEHAVTMGVALLVLIGGMLVASVGQESKAVSAQKRPLTGLTILVDAGHGGYDGGAKCRDSGRWEKELNLAVTLQLEEALVHRGAKVLMTRRTDTDLCTENRPANLTKKRQDMQNRIALAQEHQVDMVLSVHMNEYRVRAESGPQVFYRAGCEEGRLLAGCVQEALITQLQPRKERAAMAGDYFILQLDVPSVLVECGFVSNAQEEKLLLEKSYQKRVAEAIATGVEEYHRLSQAPTRTEKGSRVE